MNASEFMFLDAPNCRLELRRGVVCEQEFLGAAGGSATCRLLYALTAPYLEDTSVTVLAGGTGFLVEQSPDTVIAPNGAVFVHRDLLTTRTFDVNDTISGGDVLPDFNLSAYKLIRGAN